MHICRHPLPFQNNLQILFQDHSQLSCYILLHPWAYLLSEITSLSTAIFSILEKAKFSSKFCVALSFTKLCPRQSRLYPIPQIFTDVINTFTNMCWQRIEKWRFPQRQKSKYQSMKSKWKFQKQLMLFEIKTCNYSRFYFIMMGIKIY